MKMINLAGGKCTALVREQDDLSEKARRAIESPFEELGSDPKYLEFLKDMEELRKSGAEATDFMYAEGLAKRGINLIELRQARAAQADARLIQSIKAWTVRDEDGVDVPLTADGILSLPRPLYTELLTAVGGVEEELDVSEPAPPALDGSAAAAQEPAFPTPSSDSSPAA